MSNIIAPIILFTENDLEKIPIKENLYIRKIQRAELIELFGFDITFEDQHVVKRSQKVKDVDFWADIPKGDAQIISLPSRVFPYYLIEAESREDIEDLIFLLRLLHDKTVVCPKGIDAEGKTKFFFRPFNITQKTFFTTGDIATFSEAQLDVLVNDFHTIKQNREKDRFIRARLNICLDLEQIGQIRFIEAVGIIESILVDDNKELRFKFSLYSYYVLKKLGFDVSIKLLMVFYDIRSGLVHSGKHKKYSREHLKKEYLESVLSYAKAIYLASRRDNIDGPKILKEIEEIIGKAHQSRI